MRARAATAATVAALLASGCGAAETPRRAADDAGGCPVDLRGLVPPSPDREEIEVNVEGPSWAADGRSIVVTAEHFDAPLSIALDDCSTSVVTPQRPGLATDWPAWSPDGRRLAFVAIATAAHREGLFVMNADGSGVTRLTEGPDTFPAWSPDGASIAFTRDLYDEVEATEDRNVWIVGASGGTARRVTEGAWHGTASWSPDGEWLAIDGDTALIRVRPDGTGGEVLLEGEHTSPDWSPDGTTIVVEGLLLVPVDGSAPRRIESRESAFSPAWSPDGEWIAFVDGLNTTDLFVVRADGSGERRLTRGADR